MPVWPNIPGNRRAQLRQLSSTLPRAPPRQSYRGCPFVNIAVEFPDRSHVARQMVADNKARLLERLKELAKAAGADNVPFLAKHWPC